MGPEHPSDSGPAYTNQGTAGDEVNGAPDLLDSTRDELEVEVLIIVRNPNENIFQVTVNLTGDCRESV
jgi:hypothetical protein